ncbi:MAG: hypothetical protein AB7F31_01670 [Parachlamydiales bacterium]
MTLWNERAVGCTPAEWPAVALKEQLGSVNLGILAGMGLAIGGGIVNTKTLAAAAIGVAFNTIAYAGNAPNPVTGQTHSDDRRDFISLAKGRSWSEVAVRMVVFSGIGYLLGCSFQDWLPPAFAFCYGFGVVHVWEPLLMQENRQRISI